MERPGVVGVALEGLGDMLLLDEDDLSNRQRLQEVTLGHDGRHGDFNRALHRPTL